MEQVTTSDGVVLAVTRFKPSGQPVAHVVIAGAMGVRQDYYHPIARYLAESGMAVTTFDYRGMGFSRSGPLHELDCDVITWAERDLEALLSPNRRESAALPLLVLAHSLGGQILGLAPSRYRVRAMLTVGSGTGYYKHNRAMPLKVRLLWFVLVPSLTRLFGHFPGKRLRIVGDLPRGVALQWARWCKHPDYLVDEDNRPLTQGHAELNIPIHSISVSDDTFIPIASVEQLHGFYVSAQLTRQHIAPAAIGVERIGHFGFFHERFREKLWPKVGDWLLAQATAQSATSTRL